MKAVRIVEPFRLTIADVREPRIERPDQVLIKITCGGICGSDIGIYKGTNSLATYPCVIGHEYGGIVVEVGGDVTHVKPGNGVAVDPVRSCGHCYACTHGRPNVCSTVKVTGVHVEGGFAEYVVAPADSVYPVDTGKVPADLLCFVEPYSIGVQVNTRGRIAKDDKVLILGCGPIGLCVMQDALARGAEVLMCDLLDARLARAAELGAHRTVNSATGDLRAAVDDFTGDEGMPVVVDAVCSVDTFPLAMDLACPAGRVVVLGLTDKPSAAAQVAITKKELDVIGSRLNNRRFAEVIHGMERGHYAPEKLRTHSFHFTEAQKAFDLVMGSPDQICKVTLAFD